MELGSRLFCISFIPLALAMGQASAPPASHPQPAPIKVSVNEVIVPVTVTDEKGRFVTNLDAKDFRILENGKEQQVKFFSREQKQPVVVGFLVDLSNSSRIHWKTYGEALQELIVALLPGDRDNRFNGYLISYGMQAELQANTTNDSEKLLEKARKLKPGGGAALYDAIYMACTSRTLVKGEPVEPRRVLVIMGDGHDNTSKKTLDEVLEIAQRNLVTIYGVSTMAFGFAAEGQANLTKLADATGGRVFYPLEGLYKDVSGYLSTPSDEGNYALKVGTGGYASEVAKGIFNSVANVVGEVTTQYIIRYVPTTTDTGKVYRKIEVKVPTVPNVKVRARAGYYPFNP